MAGIPPHTCGSERVSESGFGNINLEQYACRDQVARVSRATVAEAMTGGSGHWQRACDRHLQTCYWHGGDNFERNLFGSLAAKLNYRTLLYLYIWVFLYYSLSKSKFWEPLHR
jgi:hypothetical protein